MKGISPNIDFSFDFMTWIYERSTKPPILFYFFIESIDMLANLFPPPGHIVILLCMNASKEPTIGTFIRCVPEAV
jgi:hypothetical protein